VLFPLDAEQLRLRERGGALAGGNEDVETYEAQQPGAAEAYLTTPPHQDFFPVRGSPGGATR
jgi:hypothetical protein